MIRRSMVTALAVLALTLMGFAAQAKDAPFFLHDGDRVVFYGDSITEQQMYGRDIEAYVATRFPKMRVSFLNSGWGGDHVTGGGGGPIETRLKRDVLPYKPTVVTIFLGMNDGGYTTDNPQNYQTYTTGLTHIVDELTQQMPGVRLTLLTPSFFDYAAKDRQPPAPGQGYDYSSPRAGLQPGPHQVRRLREAVGGAAPHPRRRPQRADAGRRHGRAAAPTRSSPCPATAFTPTRSAISSWQRPS